MFGAGEITQNDSVTYICTVAHTADAAHEPGTGANWADVFTVLAFRGQTGATGAQGIPGTPIAMRGAWSGETTYSSQEGVVSSEGRAFYSKIDDNLNHAPPSYPTTENDYWCLFAEKGEDGAGTGDMLADGSVAMTGALTMTQISTPSSVGSRGTTDSLTCSPTPRPSLANSSH